MTHGERLEQVATIEPTFTIVAVRFSVHQGLLETWETRSKDDSCSIPGVLRHLPVSNQTQPALSDLFNRSEWDGSISQCKESCCHSKLRGDVPSEDDLWINTEFFGQVKRSFDTCKLWNITKCGGLIHVHRAIAPFNQANDVLVEQTLFVFIGDF